jgi:hypothetical protein
MPHKQNSAGRHHIPKMRRHVTNRAESEAVLRRRGSLTIWVTDAAVAAWAAAPRAPPECRTAYSDSAALKVFGAGERLAEKHGQRSRRGWRKLHLAVDAHGGQIVAAALTDRDVDDASQVGLLLEQIGLSQRRGR